jgi:hypothetical protein
MPAVRRHYQLPGGIVITIVKAVQTSIACPAQWDMWDAEGNYYYARFRHGWGQVRQYEDENWVEAPWKPDEEIDKSVPGWASLANTSFVAFISTFETDGDEGWISLEDFCAQSGLALSPDAARVGYGTHVMNQLAADGIIAQEGSELAEIRDKWNEAGT